MPFDLEVEYMGGEMMVLKMRRGKGMLDSSIGAWLDG